MNWLMVALGGMLGALSRYAVYNYPLFKGNWFMLNTFTVNMLGCLLMGIVTELFAFKTGWPQELRILFTMGFLGAFTTFSTYGADIVVLINRQELWRAAIYVVASTGLGIAAVFLGCYIVRWCCR